MRMETEQNEILVVTGSFVTPMGTVGQDMFMLKQKHAQIDEYAIGHRFKQHEIIAIAIRNVHVFMTRIATVHIGICILVNPLHPTLIAHGLNIVRIQMG